MSEDSTEILRIALVQSDLYWEDVTANLSSLEEKIAGIGEAVDVIVLPEMFNTGFTMNSALAEPMNLTTTKWMKQIAAQTQALVVGSFAVSEAGHFYNRILCVRPDSTLFYSDKRHLFTLGKEHLAFQPGMKRLTVDWKGWKITPLICYDLRFPVWSRNSASDPYDLLIYVANWPSKRAHAWNTLLKARAIENQCYVAGVNRIGEDGNGLKYQGDSAALDYLGEPACMLGDSDVIKIARFSKTDLKEYRTSFPVLADSDQFTIG
ncbi:Omega-amidase YafV [Dyadobacter sp. CECT 9623]|uniref:Omega-amidase YafV n=1 Tax=Dyadobacter linearis TaxID=2823330 RepID=A0ABM8UTP7_9BACT|nr:amidohydrolase [Dyadobacter sp. CECT 9623]CAG5071700.1 Omega-amidase YafV [Dyadobacter sp. CECT 9623]